VDNIYIVREHGEEGQTWEHGIYAEFTAARHKARDVGETLRPFSTVQVTSYKLEGAQFVPTEEDDPGHEHYLVERRS